MPVPSTIVCTTNFIEKLVFCFSIIYMYNYVFYYTYLFQLSLCGNPLFEGAATGTEEVVIEHSK